MRLSIPVKYLIKQWMDFSQYFCVFSCKYHFQVELLMTVIGSGCPCHRRTSGWLLWLYLIILDNELNHNFFCWFIESHTVTLNASSLINFQRFFWLMPNISPNRLSPVPPELLHEQICKNHSCDFSALYKPSKGEVEKST